MWSYGMKVWGIVKGTGVFSLVRKKTWVGQKALFKYLEGQHVEKGILCVAPKGKTRSTGRHWKDSLWFCILLSLIRASEHGCFFTTSGACVGNRKMFVQSSSHRNWGRNWDNWLSSGTDNKVQAYWAWLDSKGDIHMQFRQTGSKDECKPHVYEHEEDLGWNLAPRISLSV